jgi:hypothetical protein
MNRKPVLMGFFQEEQQPETLLVSNSERISVYDINWYLQFFVVFLGITSHTSY